MLLGHRESKEMVSLYSANIYNPRLVLLSTYLARIGSSYQSRKTIVAFSSTEGKEC